MSLCLPEPLADYFAANTTFDVDAMLAPFADDAVVTDEKRTHRGREAIRAWILEATVGSEAIATPQALRPEGGDQVVDARVAGAFPGSPVLLTFRFTLAGGRIARLAIG